MLKKQLIRTKKWCMAAAMHHNFEFQDFTQGHGGGGEP